MSIQVSLTDVPDSEIDWTASVDGVASDVLNVGATWKANATLDPGGDSLFIFVNSQYTTDFIYTFTVYDGKSYVVDVAKGTIAEKTSFPWVWIGAGALMTTIAIAVGSHGSSRK